MQISWKLCRTYCEAQDFTGVVYLQEWNGKPFYWGIADRSFFGGNKRKYKNTKRSGRYNPGYKHWIEGCLRHGGLLYIGDPEKRESRPVTLKKIESYLIGTYGSEMQGELKRTTRGGKLALEHVGDVPLSISTSGS